MDIHRAKNKTPQDRTIQNANDNRALQGDRFPWLITNNLIFKTFGAGNKGLGGINFFSISLWLRGQFSQKVCTEWSTKRPRWALDQSYPLHASCWSLRSKIVINFTQVQILSNRWILRKCIAWPTKFPKRVDRPCIAQWLERPLGVREVGVRSPIASHQRRNKNHRGLALWLTRWKTMTT